MKTTPRYRIGEVAKMTGLSVDTLRYYEKAALLENIYRNEAGIRLYSEQDVSSLRFIQRAQRMNFSLAEIRDLLQMRKDPQHVRNEVRQLTRQKLQAIEAHLQELSTLRNELRLLLNLCQSSSAGCPIIDGIDAKD